MKGFVRRSVPLVPAVLFTLMALQAAVQGGHYIDDKNTGTCQVFSSMTIHIDNDSDLEDLAALNGWPGNGSVGAPYLISNLTFDGDEGSNGIYIGNVTHRLRLYNLTLTNVTLGVGIYSLSISNTDLLRMENITVTGVEYAISVEGSDSVVMENTTIIGTGSQNPGSYGIYLYDTQHCLVHNSTVKDVYFGIYVIEGVYANTSHNRVYDCKIGIGQSQHQHGKIYRNNITKCSDYSVSLDNGAYYSVEGNSITGGDQGIYLQYSDSNVIVSNDISGTNYGINNDDGSNGNSIRNNRITEFQDYGIYAQSQNVMVNANNCSDSSGVGIYAWTNQKEVKDNICINNSGGGMEVGGLGNYFEGNLLKENGNFGMRMFRRYNHNWYDRLNVVRHNVILGNDGHGILVERQVRNEIVYNVIAGNTGYGIRLEGSGDLRNNLGGNLLMANNNVTLELNPSRLQASTTSSSDDWARSDEGNYWSDHTTPNENGDGYIDEPYPIESSTGSPEDPYPLAWHSDLPAEPVNITAETAINGIQLNWTPGREKRLEVVSYDIYRGEGEGPMEKIFTVGKDAKGYLDGDVNPETVHYYSLLPYCEYGPGRMTERVIARSISIPPSVWILKPRDGEGFNSYAELFNWNGRDNESGLKGFHISLDRGESRSIGLQYSMSLSDIFSLLEVPAEERTYELGVMAEDNAGNRAYEFANFTIDMDSPDVTIISPQPQAQFNTSYVNVEWTGSDLASWIAGYRLRVDGGPWLDVGLSTSHRIHDLPDGIHELELEGWDVPGNIGQDSVRFSTDTTPPLLEVERPEGAYYINSRNVLFEWKGSDAVSGIDRYEVSLNQGDRLSVGKDTRYPFNGLEEGPYTCTIRAYDRVGNSNTVEYPFFIDLALPELEVRFPSDGSLLNTTDVKVVYEAHDSGSGIDHLEYKLDASDWVEFEGILSFSGLKEGTHTLSLTAYDGIGWSATIRVTFTIDTVHPSLLYYLPDGYSVEVDSYIELAFSEPMNRSATDAVGLSGFVRTWVSDTLLRIRPETGDLEYDRDYSFHLKGSDPAGNPLDRRSVLFHTTDTGWIEGVVVDKEGYPLPNAEVRLDDLEPFWTGQDGRFRITAPAGNYTLQIKHLGFSNITMTVSIDPGETTQMGPLEVLPLDDDNGSDHTTLILVLLLAALLITTVLAVVVMVVHHRRSRPVNHFEVREVLDQIRTSHGFITEEDLTGQSFYGLLGVKKRAKPDEIRRAYRKLAAQHHPDRLSHLAEEERERSLNEMKKINMAKGVLMDPERRRIYDGYLDSRNGKH